MTATDTATQRAQLPQLHGVLVLHKPKGPTSARCLTAIKRLGQKKIGHAGTLDPMAEGVLLVLLGHATKISGHLLADGNKTYAGTLRLGQTTNTWDAEGAVVAENDWHMVSEQDIHHAVAAWKGKSVQPVPPYSAAKHQGKPLYALARSGEQVPEKHKEIEILHAEILSVRLPYVRFRVTCSSGTYIRSLAHSLGIRLACGATLTELVREYSHPFALADAQHLDVIMQRPECLPQWVLPITRALPHWPAVAVSAADEVALRNGMPVPCHADGVALFETDKAILTSADGGALALARATQVQDKTMWVIVRGLWN